MIARRPTRTAATTLRRAFTLLEVLVVMAIILIIAGGATFATMGYLAKAKERSAEAQMAKIAQSAESYTVSNDGNYPESLSVLTQDPSGGQPLLVGGTAAITDPWGKPYQMAVVTDNFGAKRIKISTTTDSGKPLAWPKQ